MSRIIGRIHYEKINLETDLSNDNEEIDNRLMGL